MHDLTSNDHEHIAPLDDIALFYRRLGEGPPLLLLHGFFGSGEDFRHLCDVAELARDYTLLIPDLRGHGRTLNPARTLTHRQCARDVHALLDRLGLDRVRALGVSLGGNTLLHMATQQPERIEAMVITGAPSYFPSEARAIMAQVNADAQSEQEWSAMRERHRHGDDPIRALFEQARGFKDSYDDMCFTPPLLSTIRARTLIVNGDRDPFYPVSMFVEMFRAIPKASLWIMPDEGHAPVFGAYREVFVNKALTFLRGT